MTCCNSRSFSSFNASHGELLPTLAVHHYSNSRKEGTVFLLECTTHNNREFWYSTAFTSLRLEPHSAPVQVLLLLLLCHTQGTPPPSQKKKSYQRFHSASVSPAWGKILVQKFWQNVGSKVLAFCLCYNIISSDRNSWR